MPSLRTPKKFILLALLAVLAIFIFVDLAHAGQSYSSGTVFKETWGASSGAELCWTGGPTECNQPWVDYYGNGTGESIVTAPGGMPSGNAFKMQIPATSSNPAIMDTAGSFPLIPTSTPMDITFTLDVTSSSLAAFDSAQFFCVGDTFVGEDCGDGNPTAYMNFNYDGSTFSIDATGNTNTSNIPISLNTPHTIDLHIAGASSYLSIDGGASSTFTAAPNPVTEVEFGLGGGYQDPMTYYIGSDFTITASGMNGSWPPSALMDWAGQSGTPTTTTLAAGTECGNAWAGSWVPAAAGGDATFTFASGSQAFAAPLSVCGSSYTGNSNVLLHMAISSSTGGAYEEVAFNTSFSSTSVGFYFEWNTNTGVPLQTPDMFALGDNADAAASINLQLNSQEGDGNEHLALETDDAQGTGGLSSGTYIGYSLASSTWYWATFDINSVGSDSAYLYSTSGQLLGSSTFPPPVDYFSPGHLAVEIGKTGGETEPVPGYIDYSNIIVEYADAVFPLLPPTASVPSIPIINSSSTDFFLRGQYGSIFGNSQSTDFSLYNSGQVLALPLMSSTDFEIISGIIRPIFQPVKPNYTLIHYQWRDDNGTEANASSATGGVEDTALTGLAASTSIRLRTEITNDGGTIFSYSPQSFQLQYGTLSTTCSAISTWTAVGASGSVWSMYNSSNIHDGSSTTDIATSTGGVLDMNHTFITPNYGVKTTTSTVTAISVPSDSFIDMEFDVKALSSSTAGATYCFRLTNVGSATNFTYSQYPQVTLAGSAETITLTLNSSTVTLPSLTPGNTVSATTTATVHVTGATSGFTLSINRKSVTSTIASGTITFPDYTAWAPSGSTCASGQGNGTTTPGTNFSFRVASSGTSANYCSFWWGNSDVGGTAIYAGVPTSSQIIVNSTSSASQNGTSTVTIIYSANAPNSQRATSYTGTVTITAIANP